MEISRRKGRRTTQKMTASLLDIIEFSQTRNVESWLKAQSGYLVSTVSPGVVSGGSVALDNKVQVGDSCHKSLKTILTTEN